MDDSFWISLGLITLGKEAVWDLYPGSILILRQYADVLLKAFHRRSLGILYMVVWESRRSHIHFIAGG